MGIRITSRLADGTLYEVPQFRTTPPPTGAHVVTSCNDSRLWNGTKNVWLFDEHNGCYHPPYPKDEVCLKMLEEEARAQADA